MSEILILIIVENDLICMKKQTILLLTKDTLPNFSHVKRAFIALCFQVLRLFKLLQWIPLLKLEFLLSASLDWLT